MLLFMPEARYHSACLEFTKVGHVCCHASHQAQTLLCVPNPLWVCFVESLHAMIELQSL